MTPTDDLATRVGEALAADGRQLCLHAYCENQACPCRQVVLYLRDDFDELESMLRDRPLACPVCGETRISVHEMEGGADHRERKRREARQSVNAQMYEQQSGRPAPLTVVFDDRLPPAPAGWFDRLDRPRPQPGE